MYLFINSENSKNFVIIIKLISEWNKKAANKAGRINIQKLCYFAESIGVPLCYKFFVYRHGPYSQELFDHIDDMVNFGLLSDDELNIDQDHNISIYSLTEIANELLVSYESMLAAYSDKLHKVVEYLKNMSVSDLELISTMHYYYTANNGFYKDIDKDKLKELTISKVMKAKKDKYRKNEIDSVYCELVKAPIVSY